MQQYIAFFTQHWELTLLLIVVIIAIIIYELRLVATGPKRLSTTATIQLVNHENAAIIDLRENSVFKQGHIINSINIPTAKLQNSINQLSKYKNKPIILVCDAGQQAIQAQNILNKNNFEKTYILDRGIRAWKEANLPLEK